MRLFTLFLSIALVFTMHAAPRRRVVRVPAREVARVVTIADDFRLGDRGWLPGFADYSPLSSGMDLEASIAPLPPELHVDGTGYRVSGNNHSDDLFMFLSKRLTAADGIKPNTRYSVSFRIVFASNAGSGCGGIGGSPGEGVMLKAGAAGEPPQVVLAGDHYRLQLDKGNQINGGADLSAVSHIGNGTANCSGNAPYVTLERSHTHPFAVTSNEFGELWLLAGTDSGFEGITTLYYQSIVTTLTPLP
ncbi:MAG TPA: hypothetical protein VF824_19285 [Thermoanaerobaculia bacterium]|jgi:hypothetical protein